MWCRNVRSQLSAFADGELTPAMTQQVREHLAKCDRCTGEHTALKRLSMLTATIPLEEVPSSLHLRIMTSLNQANFAPEVIPARAPRRSVPPLTWAWAAFATAAIAVACSTLNRPGHPMARTYGTPVAEATPSASVKGTTPHPAVEAKYPQDAVQPVEHPIAPDSLLTARAADVPEQPVQDTDPQPAIAAEKLQAPAADTVTVADRGTAVMPNSLPSAERPQPATVSPTGKLATEQKVSEPSVATTAPMMARENLMAMPGDPIVNSTGSSTLPEPVVTEKESPTRMVGMAMETESPGEEDEGLRSFRMFLQENNRSVPQPPSTTPGRERRMRKSL